MHPALVIILLPVFLLLYRFFIHDKILFKLDQIKWRSDKRKLLISRYNKILKEHSTYYNKLTIKGKVRFIKRIYYFINDITFYGKQGMEITEKKEVIVSASAIQLTFGYKNYLFDKFRYVFIYPEVYYSKLYNNYLKGGTYPYGIVAFAWDHFKKGNKYPNDKINLGLHEMAHTLLLQLSDDKFETYIDSWFTIGRKEFLNIQEGNSNMFRSYAGTNRHEFWAVAVECFFEAPVEFKRKLPKLFEGMCVVLNQNPLNTTNDYRLTGYPKQKIGKSLNGLINYKLVSNSHS